MTSGQLHSSGDSARFLSLDKDWIVRALNSEKAPTNLRERLREGLPAEVPGEVTLDLLRAGLIPDPFDGDNERMQQWIGDIDWQYTCQFAWHEDGQQCHDLVAYGLDTVALVQLNGRLLGTGRNFHCVYRWNVDGFLQQGINTLVVTLNSPVRESEKRERLIGYYPHTEHHAFNQLRKPAFQFGWDWGIDVAGVGIWRPIGIDSWSQTRIRAVRPSIQVQDDGTGVAEVHVDLDWAGLSTSLSDKQPPSENVPMEYQLTVEGHGTRKAVGGTIAYGVSELVSTLKVPEAMLWWPRGYGEQPLYDLCVRVGTAEWKGRIGFRTVTVDTRADKDGRPFRLYINGLPIHARGFNWVPLDAFISRADSAAYRARFQDLVESNANMVRAWGGGIYETDEFYDLADEYGILVWQDFAFACAAYPETAEMRQEVETEAIQQISRLCPHPSLVVWNGSNENYVAYAQWSGFKQALNDDQEPKNAYGYGEKGWGDYYYSTLLPKLLKRLDNTRVYLPSSPMSFTPFVDANADTDGTMHIWDVWNNADYHRYRAYRPRFADEFGYQAPPAWSTLMRVIHDPQPGPSSPHMLAHQKASSGNEKLAKGMRSHLTPGQFDDIAYDSDGSRNWLIPSDRWSDLEDWHWACQLQQGQAIRFGLEHMRSLEPLNAGTLIWQLNDDWPVISWSAIDYDGHKKPLWFVARSCFAPCLATIQPWTSDQRLQDRSWEGSQVDPDSLALVLINDSICDRHMTWKVERRTLGGTVLAQQVFHVDSERLSKRTLLLNDEVATCSDPYNELLVAAPNGQEFCDTTFARTVYDFAEVIDQRLNPNPLSVEAKTCTDGYLLKITANAYARDIFCMVDKIDSSASIDGGMVSLLPGESLNWHIASRKKVDPRVFVQKRVLCCANDLRECHR